MSKILMVLTSHDRLGDTGRKTGFWLEEFAAPYYVFKDAGVSITVASPRGGQPPIDPKSDEPGNQTPSMTRFKEDKDAQMVLANTVRLATVDAKDFDTVFYPGGHGPMWDLVEDRKSITLIEEFYGAGKPVAAVCHAPAVFHHVTYQGHPLVKGSGSPVSRIRKRRPCNSRKSFPSSSRTISDRSAGNTRRPRTGRASRLSTVSSSRDRILPHRRLPRGPSWGFFDMGGACR